MKQNNSFLFALLGVITLLLFLLNLWFGSVTIGFKEVLQIVLGSTGETANSVIVMDFRLPQAVTAMATGIALGLAGLILQTLFRNPLAGPSVLGISAGAGLGVAVAILAGTWLQKTFTVFQQINEFVIVLFAVGGALSILALILYASRRVSGILTILIIGVMTGYAVSALVSMLQFFSNPTDMYSFVMWGLGSFSKTTFPVSLSLLATSFAGFLILLFYIKPMNAMITGEQYLQSIGYRVHHLRFVMVLISGILIAVTTAYTGPIGFIGLAIPHISRSLFRSSNHTVLLPATLLTGASLALLCNLLSRLPGYDVSLPVNAVTAIIGAPVVVWILLKNRHRYNN